MSRPIRSLACGLTAGLLAAALDAALIVAVDPAAPPALIVQAALFWTVAGLVVVNADVGLGDLLHGVTLTVLLNLHWYVQIAVVEGRPAMLPPLVGMSLVFGAGFGWARRLARRPAPSHARRAA